jgi:hypothetical protein
VLLQLQEAHQGCDETLRQPVFEKPIRLVVKISLPVDVHVHLDGCGASARRTLPFLWPRKFQIFFMVTDRRRAIKVGRRVFANGLLQILASPQVPYASRSDKIQEQCGLHPGVETLAIGRPALGKTLLELLFTLIKGLVRFSKGAFWDAGDVTNGLKKCVRLSTQL